MAFFTEIERPEMYLKFGRVHDSFGMTLLSPNKNSNGFEGEVFSPGYHLTVAGDNFGIHCGIVTGGSLLPQQAVCTKAEYDGNKAVMVYEIRKYSLEVEVNLTFYEGIGLIRQVNKIKNTGEKEVTITHFSSMNAMGIATDGLLPWYHDDKVRVHYCINTWEGEGQWRTGTLEQLGLYPNSVHQCNASIHVSSVGSWSTCRYFPAAMIEDIETKQIWYFNIESSTSWHYEIGHRKLDNGTEGTLYMLADCADEMHNGWYKALKPGEEFEAAPVSFGCCNGGFDEAVKELTKYKRKVLKPQNAWEDEFPVMFNDYMDSLWGQPTKEKLIPLIDAAAKAGAEGFCIDAGWFAPLADSWGNGLGDWDGSVDRFGAEGIKGILDYIKSKNMIPGLWLEIDACQMKSKAYNFPDEYFLLNHGERIGGERCFFDFRNPKVREYIMSCIDKLVAMGVGFFKNDYNGTTCSGDNKAGNSAADGLLENNKAFYSFVDEVREKYPTLIIENCGGGALREDAGILSHFHLQSTSDQEQYYRYPAIISGTLANVLPEQAGIWSYPHPLLFMDLIKDPDIIKTEEYNNKFKDGEETIFNMVSGLCGNLYLSGRIELCDDFNFALVKEGVEAYKNCRSFNRTSYPVWPTGRLRMNDNTYGTMGLISEDSTLMHLAVWRLRTDEDTIIIDLSKWAGNNAEVNMLYPSDPLGVKYVYNKAGKTLSIKFAKTYSARMFEIKL